MALCSLSEARSFKTLPEYLTVFLNMTKHSTRRVEKSVGSFLDNIRVGRKQECRRTGCYLPRYVLAPGSLPQHLTMSNVIALTTHTKHKSRTKVL